MEPIDIEINQIHKQEFVDLQPSQLTLGLSGKSLNATVVNTLRRLCYDYVPVYAFPVENIIIERNTSIFNNDEMKLVLSQIVTPDIHIPIYGLDDVFWKDVVFSNPERVKHPQDKKILELYINIENNTKDILNVTTEHVKLYEDGIELKDKFNHKFPCLIVQLRPNEVFSCKCSAVLGIGKLNAIWYAAGNAFCKEINENKYELMIESQNQMDEYEILHKACRVLKDRINSIKNLMKDKYDKDIMEKTNMLEIQLDNEDHTVGGIINRCLQDNKNIEFSGVAKPNLLIDNMLIRFKTKKNDPGKIFFDTLDYVIELFDVIQGKIENLGYEFIKYEKVNKKTKKKK
jgi:DNA-directed RNA polymerase subunit L